MRVPLTRSFEEIAELMRNAPPRTSDDVSITMDGRRLDSPEKVRAWLAEINAQFAQEDAAAAGDGPAT